MKFAKRVTISEFVPYTKPLIHVLPNLKPLRHITIQAMKKKLRFVQEQLRPLLSWAVDPIASAKELSLIIHVSMHRSHCVKQALKQS